jgi:hypothetical protein
LVPYVDLIERFVAGEIDWREFDDEYTALYRADDFEYLSPVPDILFDLLSKSDSCDPDAADGDRWAMTPDQLRTAARDILDELKQFKYLL